MGWNTSIQTHAGDAGYNKLNKGWRPVSMRPLALGLFVATSLALAVTIEILAQKSARQGGLALSRSSDEVPSVVVFSYLALPTLFAVLFSLVWTWIDLDVRRIQPWLELSRPGGCSADASLLLDYPFDFLAFVPFKAWKHRHWPVFLAGIIMMIIFWVITPLQGAIFGTQAVVVQRQTPMSASLRLLPVEQQAVAMDVVLLSRAYGSRWLGQPLPAFTSSSYALLPFTPENANPTTFPNETWTGNTTKLATELSCWPGVVTQVSKNMRAIDNGRGCSFNLSYYGTADMMDTEETYFVQYVGYWNDPHVDWFLESRDCGRAAMHQFLAIAAPINKKVGDIENITAMFCEPSYTKQEVSVTVSAERQHPDDASITPLGNAIKLGEDEFNITAFEWLIGAGFSSIQVRRDYVGQLRLEQYGRLVYKNISHPTSNVVGYAASFYNGSTAQLQDTKVLHRVFELAHQSLFSAAVSNLLSSTNRPLVTTGDIRYTLYGVVVSRSISLVVEVLLVLTAILTGAIAFIYGRTPSHLDEDPASLKALLRVLSGSERLLGQFGRMDSLDDAGLRHHISGNKYRLLQRSQGAPQLRLLEEEDTSRNLIATPPATWYRPVRPLELRPATGMAVMTILLAAVGVLVYLKKQEVLLGGLPRPALGFEVLQILENYLPVAFATLLEPFLLVVNRLLCMVQPFQDLRRGHAPRSSTIDARYGNLPPQLNVLRALRSRHFLLAAVCTISITANILAVALGAVFNESPISIEHQTTFLQVSNASLSRDAFKPFKVNADYKEHLYAVSINLSDNVSLPPWMDTRYAYLPFDDARFGETHTVLFTQAETRGFGFDPNCSPLSTSSGGPGLLNYSLSLAPGFQNQSFGVDIYYSNGTINTCDAVSAFNSGKIIGRSANEVAAPLGYRHVPATDRNGYYSLGDHYGCGQVYVAAWMRADPDDPSKTVNLTAVQCHPRIQTAMFKVTVDARGYVVRSERSGDFDDITKFLSPGLLQTLVLEANSLNGQINSADGGWHNFTISQDWLNYLLKLSLNSDQLIDPAQGVPDIDTALNITNDIYRRLGAGLFGVDSTLFTKLADPVSIPGTFTVQDIRIFMNWPAFIISIAMLLLTLLVLTWVYLRETQFYLPRLPSTISSQIAYVASGTTVQDCKVSSDREVNAAGKSESTYSFGSFIGTDGQPHVGIERDPFVVPLSTSYLRRNGASHGAWSWLRFRRQPASSVPEAGTRYEQDGYMVS